MLEQAGVARGLAPEAYVGVLGLQLALDEPKQTQQGLHSCSLAQSSAVLEVEACCRREPVSADGLADLEGAGLVVVLDTLVEATPAIARIVDHHGDLEWSLAGVGDAHVEGLGAAGGDRPLGLHGVE